jgi:hypothetical protein
MQVFPDVNGVGINPQFMVLELIKGPAMHQLMNMNFDHFHPTPEFSVFGFVQILSFMHETYEQFQFFHNDHHIENYILDTSINSSVCKDYQETHPKPHDAIWPRVKRQHGLPTKPFFSCGFKQNSTNGVWNSR